MSLRERLRSLLVVEDEPGDAGMGRKWRWRPVVETDGWDVTVGRELVMDMFQGEPVPDRVVRYTYVTLRLDPRRWRLEADHTYYDGPHCGYQVGPVVIATNERECRTCFGER